MIKRFKLKKLLCKNKNYKFQAELDFVIFILLLLENLFKIIIKI